MYGGMANKLSMLRTKNAAGGGDVTPNAVDWNDVVQSVQPVFSSTQTISGISTPITLSIDALSNDGFDLYYKINSGSWVLITSQGQGTNLASFTVSNNDTLQFKVDSAPIPVCYIVVDVYNVSDNLNLLDTFLLGRETF